MYSDFWYCVIVAQASSNNQSTLPATLSPNAADSAGMAYIYSDIIGYIYRTYVCLKLLLPLNGRRGGCWVLEHLEE